MALLFAIPCHTDAALGDEQTIVGDCITGLPNGLSPELIGPSWVAENLSCARAMLTEDAAAIPVWVRRGVLWNLVAAVKGQEPTAAEALELIDSVAKEAPNPVSHEAQWAHRVAITSTEPPPVATPAKWELDDFAPLRPILQRLFTAGAPDREFRRMVVPYRIYRQELALLGARFIAERIEKARTLNELIHSAWLLDQMPTASTDYFIAETLADGLAAFPGGKGLAPDSFKIPGLHITATGFYSSPCANGTWLNLSGKDVELPSSLSQRCGFLRVLGWPTYTTALSGRLDLHTMRDNRVLWATVSTSAKGGTISYDVTGTIEVPECAVGKPCSPLMLIRPTIAKTHCKGPSISFFDRRADGSETVIMPYTGEAHQIDRREGDRVLGFVLSGTDGGEFGSPCVVSFGWEIDPVDIEESSYSAFLDGANVRMGIATYPEEPPNFLRKPFREGLDKEDEERVFVDVEPLRGFAKILGAVGDEPSGVLSPTSPADKNGSGPLIRLLLLRPLVVNDVFYDRPASPAIMYSRAQIVLECNLAAQHLLAKTSARVGARKSEIARLDGLLPLVQYQAFDEFLGAIRDATGKLSAAALEQGLKEIQQVSIDAEVTSPVVEIEVGESNLDFAAMYLRDLHRAMGTGLLAWLEQAHREVALLEAVQQ